MHDRHGHAVSERTISRAIGTLCRRFPSPWNKRVVVGKSLEPLALPRSEPTHGHALANSCAYGIVSRNIGAKRAGVLVFPTARLSFLKCDGQLPPPIRMTASVRHRSQRRRDIANIAAIVFASESRGHAVHCSALQRVHRIAISAMAHAIHRRAALPFSDFLNRDCHWHERSAAPRSIFARIESFSPQRMRDRHQKIVVGILPVIAARMRTGIQCASDQILALITSRPAAALAPLGADRARDRVTAPGSVWDQELFSAIAAAGSATIESAFRKCSGNALPRFSARRIIPAHALALK